MSSPYDETNAVNDELRKRVIALSEENEALENKCVTASFTLIVAVTVAIISALLNVALYLGDSEDEITVLKQKLSTLEADHNTSCHYLNEAYLELDYAESWRNEIASKQFCPPPPLVKEK